VRPCARSAIAATLSGDHLGEQPAEERHAPATRAAPAARRHAERHGPPSAGYAEPDNLHTLAAVIDASAHRTESALGAASRKKPTYAL